MTDNPWVNVIDAASVIQSDVARQVAAARAVSDGPLPPGYTRSDIPTPTIDFTPLFQIMRDLASQQQAKFDEFAALIDSISAGAVTPYVHDQAVPSGHWVVTHNLGHIPAAVKVFDTAGSEWIPGVTNVDENSLDLDFNVPFGGKAYLL